MRADLTPLIIQEVLAHFLGEMVSKSLHGFNINICLCYNFWIVILRVQSLQNCIPCYLKHFKMMQIT